MGRSKVFLVLYGLTTETGGITVAALNQLKMFMDSGYDASITTFEHNANYKNIMSDLKSMGRIYENTRHINKFEYYANKNNLGENNTKLYDTEFSSPKNQGVSGKVKKYSDDGLFLHYIEYLGKNGKPIRKVEFSSDKTLSRETLYKPDNGLIDKEFYYTPDKFCYLVRHYTDGVSGKVELIDRATQETTTFRGVRAHDRYWLNELADNAYSPEALPVFICHGQGSASKIMAINKAKAKRVFFIHLNHLKKPHTYGSETVDKYHYPLNNLSSLDALVVLTNKQKADISRQYGHEYKIHAIPNIIRPVTSSGSPVKKEDTVVMVSRLAPGKNLKSAISTFQLVLRKRPDAQLHIYGIGSEHADLKKLIDKLKLNNSVHLMGYTRSPDSVFLNASVSMFTTKHEAFGLVVAESLAAGTPVVSYDYNYGASDIITHKKSGYIVQPDNEKELAKRIIHLLKRKKKASKMGSFGKADMIDRFSHEVISDKWDSLISKLTQD